MSTVSGPRSGHEAGPGLGWRLPTALVAGILGPDKVGEQFELYEDHDCLTLVHRGRFVARFSPHALPKELRAEADAWLSHERKQKTKPPDLAGQL